MPDSPRPQVLIVTMGTAASLIGKSIEETRRMVFEGQLQGFLPFAANKSWHVFLPSIERLVRHPINLPVKDGV